MADVADTSGSSVASSQTGSATADLPDNSNTNPSPEAVPPETVPPVAVQKEFTENPPVAGAHREEKNENPPNLPSNTQVAAGTDVTSGGDTSSGGDAASGAGSVRSGGVGGSSTSRPGQDGAKKPPTKRTPNDFIFGKVIGEGSYSTVMIAILY